VADLTDPTAMASHGGLVAGSSVLTIALDRLARAFLGAKKESEQEARWKKIEETLAKVETALEVMKDRHERAKSDDAHAAALVEKLDREVRDLGRGMAHLTARLEAIEKRNAP
jgi:chromosome segregation ATPase